MRFRFNLYRTTKSYFLDYIFYTYSLCWNNDLRKKKKKNVFITFCLIVKLVVFTFLADRSFHSIHINIRVSSDYSFRRID